MKDKVVVITGASRGIGAQAVRVFAAAGARVAVLARNGPAAKQLAAEVGGGAFGLACDVSDWASVSQAVDEVVAAAGRLDVLINNAGVIDPIARLAEADPDAWRACIDTNLTGVFYGLRAALPVMKKQGSGTIITVSSGAAHNALEGWGAYCSSKAGAAMLTRVAHLEESGAGLRIMGLSPGTVATDMQVQIRDSGVNPVSQLDARAHIPADWAARALLWMCSPDGAGFAGQEVSLRDEAIRRRVGLIA